MTESSPLAGRTVVFLVAAEGVEQRELTPWLLIEAGVLDGRRLTSYPSLATDLRNAVPSGSTRTSWSTTA